MSRTPKAVCLPCLLALGVLVSCWSLWAQGTAQSAPPAPLLAKPADEPPPPPEPPKPVLKIYKVWDLIDVPALPAPEKSAVPPTRLYEPPSDKSYHSSFIDRPDSSTPPPPRPRPTIGSLAAILRDSLHFEEEVSIQTIEGMFLVTANTDSHKKIEQFLSAVRKELASRRVITIQATWAIVDDEKAAKVLGSGSPAPKVLAPEAQKALEEDTAFQGSTMSVEGERSRLAAGRCQTVLTDANPIVADNIGVMTPTIQIVQWGPVLEVQANLSEDGRSVGIELDSVLSDPNELGVKALRTTGSILATSRPFADYNLVKDIDKLDFLLHTLHTSIRVPVGKSVLVGGMTLAKGPKGRSVYLLVQVNAITQ
jgi:hypothetical protein